MNVEAAEKTVSDIEAKRAACVARGTELQEERSNIAFKVHADNDPKARARLDTLNVEIATHASELASLDSALKSAETRLEEARAAEHRAAAAAAAKAARHEWSGARKDLEDIDVALAGASSALHRFYERCAAMERHGVKLPPQLTLLLTDVLVSRLMDLPKPLWRHLNHVGVEHLAPGRHRTALSLHDVWAAQVERQAAALGGEQANKPEKAA
jgi:hypothetical protein